MHNPIVIRRANIRGKRQNKKSQENTVNQDATALSVLPESAPLQPLDPAPAAEQSAAHPPRKRKPYGLAIAAAILVFAPISYSCVISVLSLIFAAKNIWEIVIGMALFGSVQSNAGSILLYLAARAANYMRKSVVLVSLELLVLQIGTYLFFREGLADILEPQNMEHPLLSIVLVCLILLCMIVLCVFSVLMLVRLLPKRPAKNAKV